MARRNRLTTEQQDTLRACGRIVEGLRQQAEVWGRDNLRVWGMVPPWVKNTPLLTLLQHIDPPDNVGDGLQINLAGAVLLGETMAAGRRDFPAAEWDAFRHADTRNEVAWQLGVFYLNYLRRNWAGDAADKARRLWHEVNAAPVDGPTGVSTVFTLGDDGKLSVSLQAQGDDA